MFWSFWILKTRSTHRYFKTAKVTSASLKSTQRLSFWSHSACYCGQFMGFTKITWVSLLPWVTLLPFDFITVTTFFPPSLDIIPRPPWAERQWQQKGPCATGRKGIEKGGWFWFSSPLFTSTCRCKVSTCRCKIAYATSHVKHIQWRSWVCEGKSGILGNSFTACFAWALLLCFSFDCIHLT